MPPCIRRPLFLKKPKIRAGGRQRPLCVGPCHRANWTEEGGERAGGRGGVWEGKKEKRKEGQGEVAEAAHSSGGGSCSRSGGRASGGSRRWASRQHAAQRGGGRKGWWQQEGLPQPTQAKIQDICLNIFKISQMPMFRVQDGPQFFTIFL